MSFVGFGNTLSLYFELDHLRSSRKQLCACGLCSVDLVVTQAERHNPHDSAVLRGQALFFNKPPRVACLGACVVGQDEPHAPSVRGSRDGPAFPTDFRERPDGLRDAALADACFVTSDHARQCEPPDPFTVPSCRPPRPASSCIQAPRGSR